MYVINEKTKVVANIEDTEDNIKRINSGFYGSNCELYTGEVEEVDGVLYAKGFAPAKTEEEIRAELDNLTMTKGEFLTLAINLSAIMGQPISLEEIEDRIFAKDEQGKYLTPDIAFLFSYATTVKRGDAMMEKITTEWGYPVELLDIMFTQKDELLRKIVAGEPLEMPQ